MSIFELPVRDEPPMVNSERAGLEAWLEWHRQTLLTKCAGLDAAQLARRSVPPSSLSLLGLIRHLAEVERSWFRRVLAGESTATAGPIFYSDERPDDDFDGAVAERAAADRAAFLAELDIVRAVAARYDLDDVGTHRSGRLVDLRWIYTHMIEEYARHNGHADLLRECIDGVTGE
ncbi:MAG TPA: DinB family protein [Kineosporiaceae bacterium]|jgi:hypothetical protein|nr:DinB family protein [Kineosporiaceae bacterium]